MLLIEYIVGIITMGIIGSLNIPNHFIIGFAIIWSAYMICSTIKDIIKDKDK